MSKRVFRDKDDTWVIPFSSGTEYADWLCSNCDQCARTPEDYAERDVNDPALCEIEAYLCAGSISGVVPPDIFKRMGEHTGACTERVTEEQLKQEQIREYAKHQHDIFVEVSDDK